MIGWSRGAVTCVRMANWTFVFAYSAKDAAWLEEQGYPHPAVLPDNTMPTTADMNSRRQTLAGTLPCPGGSRA
jgi:hypothetical protein